MDSFVIMSEVKIVFVWILAFNYICNTSFCANILAVSTVPSHSHHIWTEHYLLGLVAKGHNVTFLSHDESSVKIQNYTVITLEGIFEKCRETFHLEDFIDYGPMDTMALLWGFSHFVCEEDLKTEGLKTLMDYPMGFKFDLIVWDIHLGQCLYPLIDRFGSPPVIAISPFGNQHVIADTLGQHIYSYIPYFMSDSSDKMTVWQRLKNLFYIISLNISRRLYFLNNEYSIAQNYFGKNIRNFEEIEREVSLLLVNSDNFLNYPQPYAPNIIPVGGLHIKEAKKLPEDLENIFEESKGVILLSLGSNLQLDQLEETKLTNLLEILSKLPYTILTKCSCEDIELPQNIIAKKWLPQNDILAHPKTKLLFTHGGALSLQEAFYHGVPVVGMPFYLDQHANIAAIESNRVGKKIDFLDFDPEDVEKTIKEVLLNPMYLENAKSIASKYRDRPESPLDLAIFWTEYILRHKTASHFDVAARDMYFYQTTNLDILIIIALIVLSVLISSYSCISYILRRSSKYQNVNRKISSSNSVPNVQKEKSS